MNAAQRILLVTTVLAFVAIVAFPPVNKLASDNATIVERHFACAADLPHGARVDWSTLGVEIGALILVAGTVAVAIHPYRIAGERD